MDWMSVFLAGRLRRIFRFSFVSGSRRKICSQSVHASSPKVFPTGIRGVSGAASYPIRSAVRFQARTMSREHVAPMELAFALAPGLQTLRSERSFSRRVAVPEYPRCDWSAPLARHVYSCHKNGCDKLRQERHVNLREMANTCTQIYVHIVFAVSARACVIYWAADG